MASSGDNNNKGSLVLLDFWVSPFGQRCRIALAEKGIPYEYSEQELLGTKSDLLLRSNPIHKKIPVLLHDDRPICESLIILNYLEDAFPNAKALLPADPYARAQAGPFLGVLRRQDLRARHQALEAQGRRGRAGERGARAGAEEPGRGARGEGVLWWRGGLRVRGCRGRDLRAVAPQLREVWRV
ncbi:unnamed protein product [Urochloa humidicola]